MGTAAFGEGRELPFPYASNRRSASVLLRTLKNLRKGKTSAYMTDLLEVMANLKASTE